MLGSLGGVEIIRRRAELGNLSPAVSSESSQDEIVACRIALHRSMYSFLHLRRARQTVPNSGAWRPADLK
jgi:hypothetical protein